MLEVSKDVRERLHSALSADEVRRTQGKCFRIVPQDDRSLTLNLATPAPSDSTVEHDGHVVLAVPKALQEFFADKRLDIDSNGRLKVS